MILLTVLLAAITGGCGTGDTHIYVANEIVSDIGVDVFFEIVHPPELAFTYRIRPAADIGATFNASFSEKGIALVPTEPSTCCRLPDNAEELMGRVALIQRGDCSFSLKTAIAQRAGAKAAIISDYPASMEQDRDSPMWMDQIYTVMGDTATTINEDINIPAGFLLGKNGRIIRRTLQQLELLYAIINIPVNLTFTGFSEHREPPWVNL